MDFIGQIFSNQILVTGLCAWVVAQIIKTIIHAIINRGIDFSRLLGDGGMPSGHSATVTAAAVSCGIQCGFDSPVFALAAILAIVVMHDATGVRRETGKQAVILNDLIDAMKDLNMDIPVEQKLKLFVGHTPLQVFFGSVLGIIIAVVGNQLW